eukprot:TRINITY_DN4722_c0_g1_i3.p1 TRINITY_DN4722_c0_g1~~TRINITY_DN4722_c0_g1_i3.p1  ORF type:complete len:158 (-),score=21.48 TRINITY_DN4722_c0_g1_i3:110-583(-)
MSNEFERRYPYGHFPTETPCHALLVSGIVQGGFVGLIAGLYFGQNNSIRNVISPPSFGITHYPTNSALENFKLVGRFSLFTTLAGMVYTGTFFGVKCLTERTRNKRDVWNSTIGGCAAGALLGTFYTRNLAWIMWNCLSLGILASATHFFKEESQTD